MNAYIKAGIATIITVSIPIKAYIEDAKCICVLLISLLSIVPVKKAREEIPPAGKKMLIKFLLMKSIIESIKETLHRAEANA